MVVYKWKGYEWHITTKRAGIVIDARRNRHNMDMQLVTPRVVAMAVAMETMS